MDAPLRDECLHAIGALLRAATALARGTLPGDDDWLQVRSVDRALERLTARVGATDDDAVRAPFDALVLLHRSIRAAIVNLQTPAQALPPDVVLLDERVRQARALLRAR